MFEICKNQKIVIHVFEIIVLKFSLVWIHTNGSRRLMQNWSYKMCIRTNNAQFLKGGKWCDDASENLWQGTLVQNVKETTK